MTCRAFISFSHQNAITNIILKSFMINRIYHSCSCIIEFFKFVAKKSDKILFKSRILSLFSNSFDKFNNT